MAHVVGAIGALLIGFVVVLFFMEPFVPSGERPSARTTRGPGAGSAMRP